MPTKSWKTPKKLLIFFLPYLPKRPQKNNSCSKKLGFSAVQGIVSPILNKFHLSYFVLVVAPIYSEYVVIHGCKELKPTTTFFHCTVQAQAMPWIDQFIWNPTIFNIIRWFAGTNDSSTKGLMFQVLFFFIISFKILCKNPLNLFFKFSITLQR